MTLKEFVRSFKFKSALPRKGGATKGRGSTRSFNQGWSCWTFFLVVNSCHLPFWTAFQALWRSLRYGHSARSLRRRGSLLFVIVALPGRACSAERLLGSASGVNRENGWYLCISFDNYCYLMIGLFCSYLNLLRWRDWLLFSQRLFWEKDAVIFQTLLIIHTASYWCILLRLGGIDDRDRGFAGQEERCCVLL